MNKEKKAINNQGEITLFCTGMCNNSCIMCCQPPIKYNDIDALFTKNLEIIQQLPDDTPLICITGGEPTLLGNKLIQLIDAINKILPNTDILLLTNGRLLSDENYVNKLCSTSTNRLIVDVELHSDYSLDHDYITGAPNSYQETIAGIYNLAANDINIEIRIIICKMNSNRLLQIAHFIHKNLPFVSRIIFMGMECIGYAYDNYRSIWVEPDEYSSELHKAVEFLSEWGYDVCVFNIPLCLLPTDLHPFAKKSISPWKISFDAKCNICSKKNQCCGLFATSKIRFPHLLPFTE
jgi:His-Xaa-Ser system radical SAM maturase HxsC